MHATAAVILLLTGLSGPQAGEELLPTSAPLPFYAYPFLVITFIGWIWSLLRESE